MPIFEFFSGIGGLHLSLKTSNLDKIKYDIVPFDVNLNANSVYHLNFGIEPCDKSLETLHLEEYEQICTKKDNNSNIWLLSPPCQPFTSQGKELDLKDERSNAFRNLIGNIFAETKYPPQYIFLENVKNFEVIIISKLNSIPMPALCYRKF
jgi:tRNA (cytosine38-C5)-methyltransferase